jgi:hypothetical protein
MATSMRTSGQPTRVSVSWITRWSAGTHLKWDRFETPAYRHSNIVKELWPAPDSVDDEDGEIYGTSVHSSNASTDRYWALKSDDIKKSRRAIRDLR